MAVLTRFNPLRAIGDLRRFLAARGRHEIIFLFAALIICTVVVGGFAISSNIDKPYVAPDIVYVQSWRADRTDAEIIAQQKIDMEKQKVQDAKEAEFEAKKRASFKRLDDQLKRYGL